MITCLSMLDCASNFQECVSRLNVAYICGQPYSTSRQSAGFAV